MRDRLIELINKKQESGWKFVGEGEEYTTDVFNFELADHLLANGVIVPPCKVGDTVFVLSQGAGFSVVWNVYKSIVKAVHLDKWGQLFVHVETDRENVGGYVEIERVFLTREQAEAALAQREGK